MALQLGEGHALRLLQSTGCIAWSKTSVTCGTLHIVGLTYLVGIEAASMVTDLEAHEVIGEE